MTTMTLEVPDDVATQLQHASTRLQGFHREVLNAKSAQVASLVMREASVPPMHQEIAEPTSTVSRPCHVPHS